MGGALTYIIRTYETKFMGLKQRYDLPFCTRLKILNYALSFKV